MPTDGFSRWLDAFTAGGVNIQPDTERILRIVYEMGSAESIEDARAIVRSSTETIYNAVQGVLKKAAAGNAGWWDLVTVLDAVSGTIARIQWLRKRTGSQLKGKRVIVPAQPYFWQEFVDRGDCALCHLHADSDGSVIAAIVCPTGTGYEPTVAVVQVVDTGDTAWFTKCLAKYSYSLKSSAMDQAVLGELLRAFGDRLIPAFESLRLRGKHLIFLPQGVTSCLPLHAIYSKESGLKSKRPNYLLEQFRSISYVHSVCELQGQKDWFYSNEQFRRTKETRHLAVVDRSALDLSWVALEEHTARLFAALGIPVDIVTSASKLPATYEAYGFVNWSGHASSSIGRWSDSYLVLDGRRVTAGEILDSWEMRSYPKVVLSACETGADLGVDHPMYEYCGLDFAVKIAGASEVVSSMWKVRDDTAALTSTILTEWHYTQPKLTAGEALSHIQRAMLTGSWKNIMPSAEGLRKQRAALGTTVSSELLDEREAFFARLRSLSDDAFSGVDAWGVFRCAGFPFECGTGSFMFATGA